MAGDTRRVLLLGAGMVSDPLAHYYAQQSRVALTVAADSQTAGRRLAQIGDNIESHVVDVIKEPKVIEELVASHDLVISLLPYTFHEGIAKLCIRHGRNLVTSSYITPELQALDEDAQRAGITIMNESGLDPGQTRFRGCAWGAASTLKIVAGKASPSMQCMINNGHGP